MPQPIKLRLIIKILESKDFLFISQKGSHAKYRKSGKLKYTVILKMTKKDIPYGTFKSILFQSGLKESDFRK